MVKASALRTVDPFNPGLDRGNADFDIRHRFVVSSTWEVPYFKHSDNQFFKYGLGGWNISTIFRASTGTPFTVFDCNSPAFDVCHRLIPDDPSTTQFDVGKVQDLGGNSFNLIPLTTAFTSYVNPLTGTADFGNCTVPGQGATQICPFPANMLGRNAFRGPGNWNIDLGITKEVQVREGFGLQFRGELINAFNHSNLFVNGSLADVSSQDFVPGFKANNRDIQLSVKVKF